MVSQIFNHKHISFVVSFFMFSCMLSSLSVQAQQTAWVVPQTYVNLKNPVKPDSASLKSAKALYIKYCAPCHGVTGKGDGPANASINPNPANHTSILMLNETDGALWYKITVGRNPMPENRSILTETQRWELVNYIRTLAKSSSK